MRVRWAALWLGLLLIALAAGSPAVEPQRDLLDDQSQAAEQGSGSGGGGGSGGSSGDGLSKVLQRYLSNEELEAHLQDFVGRCGEIAQLSKIGKSVEGRPLTVLEISENPGKTEAKPNIKYVGGVHGDEPTGRMLSLALAEWLCAHWRTDARAKRVVTETHLYLLPAMNPDGFAHKTRENKGGQDLNRDFPDRYSRRGMAPSGGEQPETKAVMDWTLATGFVASASFHEGAVVANYPWDGTPNRTTQYWASPDDATYRYLARTYARAHTNMWQSKEFKDGITNGAAWYPIYGSMQDWNYVVGGCYELTLELSDNKWPPEPGLAALFERNRGALLDFALMAAVGGLRGTVKAQAASLRANKGQETAPLGGANITVVGIEAAVVHSRQPFGDFYRPLAPGTYGVLITAEGHEPFSTNITIPEDGSGVVLDVILQPLGSKRGGTEAVAKAIATVDSIKNSAKGGSGTTAAAAAVGGGEAAGLARWHGKDLGGGLAVGGGAKQPRREPREPGATWEEQWLVGGAAALLVLAGFYAVSRRRRLLNRFGSPRRTQ